jgi:hypothetical protein
MVVEQIPQPQYQQPAQKPITLADPPHSARSDEDEDDEDDADDGLTLPGLGLSPHEDHISPQTSNARVNPEILLPTTNGSPKREQRAAQRYLDPASNAEAEGYIASDSHNAQARGGELQLGTTATEESARGDAVDEEEMIDVRLSSSSDDEDARWNWVIEFLSRRDCHAAIRDP